METFYHTTLLTRTPLGTLRLAASARGLAQLSFIKPNGKTSDMPSAFTRSAGTSIVGSDRLPIASAEWIESPAKMKPYVAQLEAYIGGKRCAFDFPLDLRGTDFQKKCWHALLAIPFGETRSYADIANSVGSAAGFRAVGQANHRNPVAIVVPCHRVITTAGTLGGYGGGLPTKLWLLSHEGVDLNQMNVTVSASRSHAKERSRSGPSAQLPLL